MWFEIAAVLAGAVFLVRLALFAKSRSSEHH